MIYSYAGNIMVRDILYTYLYETKCLSGIGYVDFLHRIFPIFSKTMVG